MGEQDMSSANHAFPKSDFRAYAFPVILSAFALGVMWWRGSPVELTFLKLLFVPTFLLAGYGLKHLFNDPTPPEGRLHPRRAFHLILAFLVATFCTVMMADLNASIDRLAVEFAVVFLSVSLLLLFFHWKAYRRG
jgi:hypothetical protein